MRHPGFGIKKGLLARLSYQLILFVFKCCRKNIYVEAFNTTTIRDVMLFISSSKPIPDEKKETVWNVTARVWYVVSDPSDYGILTFEVKVENSTEYRIRTPIKRPFPSELPSDVTLLIPVSLY